MPERPPDKRIFTYEEAVSLLPRVRRLTEEAQARVEALGERVDAGSDASQSQADDIVNDWARSILDLGVDVKGLWLVDFDNGSGYYCWKHPEPGLQFYHSYEEGFGGRVRIH
jgi:hypothetical protein